MSPHYSERLVSTEQNLAFLDVVGKLGLEKGLWRASYGLPSEVGRLPHDTSLILLELRARSEGQDTSCFLVDYSPDGTKVIISPYTGTHAGCGLAQSPGFVLSLEAYLVGGTRLQTDIKATRDFRGIDRPGFHQVLFWNRQAKNFIVPKTAEEFEINVSGGVILVPRFHFEGHLSRSRVHVIPISELTVCPDEVAAALAEGLR